MDSHRKRFSERIRKRKRYAATTAHFSITHDLLIQILSKLAVKSLLRFKCVCKAWSVLIDDDPYFRNLHSENMTRKHEPFILNLYHRVSKRIYLLKFQRYGRSHPLNAFKGRVSVYGNCNGLVCLGRHTQPESYEILIQNKHHKDEIALWNPSRREFRILPKINPNQGNILPPLYLYSWVAFGFDRQDNDYKVVKFSKSPSCSLMEVYSLSKDSWRQTEVEMPKVILKISSSPTYLNGVCYWINNSNKIILAFDMHKEVFDVKPLPPFNLNLEPNEVFCFWRCQLAVLNVSLTLVRKCIIPRYRSKFHIWMFEYNDGIKSKYATVTSSSGYFLGFWSNGDVVIGNAGYILLYNVTSGKITRKLNLKYRSPALELALITYAGGLVSVGNKI